MFPRAEILCSIVVLSLVVLNLSVEATRESRFFNKEPAYTNPNGGENGGSYTDSKEWYPTKAERGVENSYNANAYYAANEGQGNANAYGNRQGESYRTGENWYAGDAQYFSQNEKETSKYGNGYYDSSGDWHGSNAGYGQGGEFASGYGKGSNGGYGGGYSNEFANGNGYGAGTGGWYGNGKGNGNGNGNGNGEYVSNNGYYQQNP